MDVPCYFSWEVEGYFGIAFVPAWMEDYYNRSGIDGDHYESESFDDRSRLKVHLISDATTIVHYEVPSNKISQIRFLPSPVLLTPQTPSLMLKPQCSYFIHPLMPVPVSTLSFSPHISLLSCSTDLIAAATSSNLATTSSTPALTL